MPHKKRPRFIFPFIILAAIGLFGFIVMRLWNYVLPPVTGVKELSYWQAVALLVLCKILFGSFRPGGGGFRRGAGPWRNKLMNMTEEEREKFRAEWRARRFGNKQPPGGN